MRTLAFSLFASAFWALLPLIARKFGAEGFGAMLAFFGVGALAGAGVLSLARRRLSPDAVIAVATLIFAVALCGLVRAQIAGCRFNLLPPPLGWPGSALWPRSTLAAQTAAPAWVRARVISMYVLVLQGGLALGSALWGVVASNDRRAVHAHGAAAALAAGLLLAPWYRLRQSNGH